MWNKILCLFQNRRLDKGKLIRCIGMVGTAYNFLWNERMTILRAAFMSVLVTVVGTIISIALNTSMGYVVSRRNFKLKTIYTWLIFIPMVFNAGMLASYVVVNNILGLNNSIWALILPLACSAFSVTICRTFFRTTVRDSSVSGPRSYCRSPSRSWRRSVCLQPSAIGTTGFRHPCTYRIRRSRRCSRC